MKHQQSPIWTNRIHLNQYEHHIPWAARWPPHQDETGKRTLTKSRTRCCCASCGDHTYALVKPLGSTYTLALVRLLGYIWFLLIFLSYHYKSIAWDDFISMESNLGTAAWSRGSSATGRSISLWLLVVIFLLGTMIKPLLYSWLFQIIVNYCLAISGHKWLCTCSWV